MEFNFAFDQPAFWISLMQIIWIDLLLSGDNAVVIALACRKLPADQRKMGILLGAGAAVGLRIIFAFFITFLLGVPFLKIAGGVLLFWIAIKLATDEHEEHADVEASSNLWGAVRTIAIADAVMSLDNVVAIAAAAKGHPELFIFGLLLTIPLIIMGSTLLSTILQKYPFLVWLGAALLGWIAGEMILGDVLVVGWLQGFDPALVVPDPETQGQFTAVKWLHYAAAAAGAAIVIALAYFVKRKKHATAEGTIRDAS
ncbi:TerC family protein [Chenggangzhangella methanolivorans]|uniref:TerC family protein n=1 Tax=Chenggangzhangella methanolivorans TaxID=1437009 RepID=A0A9E6R9K1_9HYPH|nr:TerC family protein [Chenggangzhangella methanolivorans]QZO00057.1 TerC family protein [Chenggangzhangella methanolivorans]